MNPWRARKIAVSWRAGSRYSIRLLQLLRGWRKRNKKLKFDRGYARPTKRKVKAGHLGDTARGGRGGSVAACFPSPGRDGRLSGQATVARLSRTGHSTSYAFVASLQTTPLV